MANRKAPVKKGNKKNVEDQAMAIIKSANFSDQDIENIISDLKWKGKNKLAKAISDTYDKFKFEKMQSKVKQERKQKQEYKNKTDQAIVDYTNKNGLQLPNTKLRTEALRDGWTQELKNGLPTGRAIKTKGKDTGKAYPVGTVNSLYPDVTTNKKKVKAKIKTQTQITDNKTDNKTKNKTKKEQPPLVTDKIPAVLKNKFKAITTGTGGIFDYRRGAGVGIADTALNLALAGVNGIANKARIEKYVKAHGGKAKNIDYSTNTFKRTQNAQEQARQQALQAELGRKVALEQAKQAYIQAQTELINAKTDAQKKLANAKIAKSNADIKLLESKTNVQTGKTPTGGSSTVLKGLLNTK